VLGILVLTYLYIFGNINLLIGKTLLQNSNPDNDANKSILSICYQRENIQNFYLNEKEAEDLNFIDISFMNSTEEFDKFIKNSKSNFTRAQFNSHQIITSLNEVSKQILYNYILVEKNDFDSIGFLQKIREMIERVTNPLNAIITEDDDKKVVKTVEKSVSLFNNLINDEGLYPLNKYLKCDRFTNFQLYFTKDSCKYPFSKDASYIHDQICYDIPSMTEEVLFNYLNDNLGEVSCDCDYFLNEPEFCERISKISFKDFIINGFRILKNFYNDYERVVEILYNKIFLK